MSKSDIPAVAWQGVAQCRACAIRDLVLFADLEEPDFSLIYKPIDEISYSPGAALYHAGDAPGPVFTVRAGLVKLVHYLPTGDQRIVRLLRPGDLVGQEALLGQPYQHSAVALHPTLTCRIPREVVRRLGETTPRLTEQLLRRWQRALDGADAALTRLGTGSARARVARLFVMLAGDDPEGACDLFGREDVGALLGVTTETASRVVADFKRQRLVAELRPNRFRCNLEALDGIGREA